MPPNTADSGLTTRAGPNTRRKDCREPGSSPSASHRHPCTAAALPVMTAANPAPSAIGIPPVSTLPSSGRHRVWVSKVVGNYPCHDLYHIRARPDGTYMGPQVLIDHNVLHKVVKFEVASRRPVAETLLGTP